MHPKTKGDKVQYRKLLVLTVLAGAVTPSFAVQNLKLGNVEVNPYARIEEKYDDNIYLEANSSDRNASWINKSVPGVKLNLPLSKRYSLSVDYRWEFLSYTKDSGVNNAKHQLLDANLDLELPKDSSFKVYERFMDTTDQAFSELTERARRRQNDVGANLEWSLGKDTVLLAGGNYTAHHYRSAANATSLNREDKSIGGGFGYKVQPKTLLFGEFYYGDINYLKNNVSDSVSRAANVGVKGKLSPKVEATLKAGGKWRRYANALTVSGVPSPRSARMTTYSVNLNWKPKETCTVDLTSGRDFQESVFGANRFYRSDFWNLAYNRKMGSKWDMGLGGYFENGRYQAPSTVGGQTDRRLDQISQASVRVGYAVQKWLKLGADYVHRTRNSNFSAFNYDDNITGVNLRLDF